MTPQEIKKLKSKLLKEKKILEDELGRIATEDTAIKGNYRAHFHKPEPDDTLDEKAHSITDYEEERAVEQSLELRLREVNDTLKKIEEGTYGICDKCQAPIEEKRLKVVPLAKLCLNCAKKTKLL
jgi:RNA polymerase-binding transcription factor DksA